MIKLKVDWSKTGQKPSLTTANTTMNVNNTIVTNKDGKFIGNTVPGLQSVMAAAGISATENGTITTVPFVRLTNDDEQSRTSVKSFGGAGSAFTATTPIAQLGQICCLMDDGVRCTRIAGNASYSKRIQKTVQQRKLRLITDDTANHTYICDHHKNIIQSIRTLGKRKRKDSCEDENNGNSNDGYGSSLYDPNSDLPQVDLSALQVNTLRRYKRHYRIQTRPGINKLQLAETLMKHFRNQPVNEKEVITYFIYMVKTNRNKLD